MNKTVSNIININVLTMVSISILTINLTACQKPQAVQNEQANQSEATKILQGQVTKQKKITFGKPVLQEEVKFDKPIITKQTMTLAEQLAQYNWQLKNAVDSHNKAITALTKKPEPVVLNFVNDKENNMPYQSISFSVGCNSMSGNYQLKEKKLSISPIISTKIYCENMDLAESKLANLMEGKSKLSLTHDMLSQTTADGSTLSWQGALTNTVKYGKGETIFLEVAPQTEVCSSVINQKCLKVRDVYFNDNGTKSGISDWRLMKQPIEGYNHDPKYHKVLRINKHITNPDDVKGKQLVYVLDMVVETKVVQ